MYRLSLHLLPKKTFQLVITLRNIPQVYFTPDFSFNKSSVSKCIDYVYAYTPLELVYLQEVVNGHIWWPYAKRPGGGEEGELEFGVRAQGHLQQLGISSPLAVTDL